MGLNTEAFKRKRKAFSDGPTWAFSDGNPWDLDWGNHQGPYENLDFQVSEVWQFRQMGLKHLVFRGWLWRYWS